MSLKDAHRNTSVVMVSLGVARIQTVRMVTMRGVIVVRAATIAGPLMKLVEVVCQFPESARRALVDH